MISHPHRCIFCFCSNVREWIRIRGSLSADAVSGEESNEKGREGGRERKESWWWKGGGEKERERRGWTGWWRTAGRSSPFSLRQDTQVLSPIVFRCRLLHASLHRPATTPLRLLRRLVRKLSALVPGLFMPRWTTRHVARTRYDSRRPCSVFRWVNGPRAPGETTGCWEKSRELGMGNLSLPRGYRYYRSDFARLEVEWGRKRPVASPCLFFSECCFETVQLLLWESERASSSGETILDGIRLLFTGDWRIFINAFLTTEQRFLPRRRWISIRFIFNFQLAIDRWNIMARE